MNAIYENFKRLLQSVLFCDLRFIGVVGLVVICRDTSSKTRFTGGSPLPKKSGGLPGGL